MVASDSVLKRYALAYIKKSGGSNNIEGFLQHCNTTSTGSNLTWSEGNFEKIYKEFTGRNSGNGQNTGSGRDQQTTSPQIIHVHTQNTGLSFWDYLLLQCCIDSLFGGRGHTTNVTNINYGHNESREDKKKESEDNRKLLALGIVATVVCVAFHIGMCFWYHSSKKAARKEEKIDYLDNKLKMFRNIEFAVSAVSLVALITCVFYPVLPVWGLAILGVNSLVCFAGGLAFHMKHEKESDNIEKAKGAVRSYLQDTSPSAPLLSELNNSNVGGVFGN